MGKPLKLTPSAIRAASALGEVELAIASSWWRRVAPAGLRGLLEAGSAEG